jgi:hypothetical protein
MPQTLEYINSESSSGDEEMAQAPTKPLPLINPIPAVIMAAQHNYLEGTARKWYLFSNLHGDWEDQAADPATANAVAVPFAVGLRTVFLQKFKQDNFALIQEAKLRQRVQGEEEDAASYYYDILHMCHVVNPNMPQTQRLDFWNRGLHKALVNKIYTLKPTICKEFLEVLKLHTKASLILDKRAWTEKNRLNASPSPSIRSPKGRGGSSGTIRMEK